MSRVIQRWLILAARRFASRESALQVCAIAESGDPRLSLRRSAAATFHADCAHAARTADSPRCFAAAAVLKPLRLNAELVDFRAASNAQLVSRLRAVCHVCTQAWARFLRSPPLRPSLVSHRGAVTVGLPCLRVLLPG